MKKWATFLLFVGLIKRHLPDAASDRCETIYTELNLDTYGEDYPIESVQSSFGWDYFHLNGFWFREAVCYCNRTVCCSTSHG